MYHTTGECAAMGMNALQLRATRGRTSQAALRERASHGPIPFPEVQKLTRAAAGQNSV